MTENEPDWGVLIRDCFNRPNDDAVLTTFFNASLPYIRASLLALYSREVGIVEDALQTACLKFLTIFRNKAHSNFSLGYFIVIARNCLIDELRRRKGHLPIDDVAEAELPSTSHTAGADLKMLLMQNALLQMDVRCQFVLQSYYINETDPKVLASWLEISPESIHMTIKRCRDRLKKILSETATSVPR